MSNSSDGLGTANLWSALEFNVLVAGLGALPWIVAVFALFGVCVPVPPDDWKWWYAAVALVAVVALFLLGLLVEGLAIVLEKCIAGRHWKWYSPCAQNGADSRCAQRWIWTSPQAAVEFSRRRVRMLVARNTAFNTLVLTLMVAGYLLVHKPSAWYFLLPGTLLCGSLLTWLFSYVWVSACAAWGQALSAAGPPDAA